MQDWTCNLQVQSCILSVTRVAFTKAFIPWKFERPMIFGSFMHNGNGCEQASLQVDFSQWPCPASTASLGVNHTVACPCCWAGSRWKIGSKKKCCAALKFAIPIVCNMERGVAQHFSKRLMVKLRRASSLKWRSGWSHGLTGHWPQVRDVRPWDQPLLHFNDDALRNFTISRLEKCCATFRSMLQTMGMANLKAALLLGSNLFSWVILAWG